MDHEHRGWLKELLEWLHHAYWIREFLLSSGLWTSITTWAVKSAYLPADYKWPVTILLVGLSMYLLVLIRPLWQQSKKHASLPQQQDPTTFVIRPTDTGLPADVDIKKFIRLSYRTPELEAEVRKNFRLLAQQEAPGNHEKFYLEFIGIGFIAVGYDNIWHAIYASQLQALMEVNRNNGILPMEKLKPFHRAAEAKFPSQYKEFNITFDDWFKYLTANTLVIHHPTDMVEITVRGKDFLKYLAHWGRGADEKRL